MSDVLNHHKDSDVMDDRRLRNAFWIAVVMAALTLSLSIYSFLTAYFRYKNFRSAIAFAMFFIVSLFCIWLVRRRHIIMAMILQLLLVWIIDIVLNFVLYGVGLTTAMLSLTISVAIAITTLPSRYLRWVILGAVLSVLVQIAADMFWTGVKTDNPFPIVNFIVYIFLLVSFILILYRQFPGFDLRTKLIMVLVTLAFGSIGGIATYNQYVSSEQLTREIGAKLKMIADSRASVIEQLLKNQLDLLTTLSINQNTQDEIVAASASYSANMQETSAFLEKQDKTWMGAASGDPLIVSRLTNETAIDLAEFSRRFPEHVEVFITDRMGGLVASNERTSDYYQADEDWWQQAYVNGRYIGNPMFDESTQTYSILMALSIKDWKTNEVIGIIRTTYNLSVLEGFTEVREGLGVWGEADIVFGGNPSQIIHEGKLDNLDLATEELFQNADGAIYAEGIYEGNMVLLSASKIESPNQELGSTELGWKVIVHQRKIEAIAPVNQQSRIALLITLMVALVVSLVGAWFAHILSTPIERLRDVAERIGLGDLNARAAIESSDEIGTLARSINITAEQLSLTLSGLEQRIVDRTRAIETAATVGRSLSTILRPDELVREVVNQIQQAFSYYHVHIYLFDETHEYLIMTGGSGQVGQTMLERGHKIPAGRGLVGRAAATGTVVLVQDTAQDPGWLPNPLLPDTRSELAVPILIGDDIFGALDVQQNTVNGLTRQDADILELIASQVAISLNNARLYREAEYSSEQERRFREAVEQVQRTSTVDDALKIATREVGKLVNSSLAWIKIEPGTKDREDIINNGQ